MQLVKEQGSRSREARQRCPGRQTDPMATADPTHLNIGYYRMHDV